MKRITPELCICAVFAIFMIGFCGALVYEPGRAQKIRQEERERNKRLSIDAGSVEVEGVRCIYARFYSHTKAVGIGMSCDWGNRE